MSEEMLFDFSKLPRYEWDDLYYITYELDISLTSIKEAIGHHTEMVNTKRTSLQEAINKDD